MRPQVTLVVALAITISASAAAQTPNEIKIGIGGPLTTTSAGFGVEMRQAVDLAIDERNGAGGLDGIKIIGVALDDKADAAAGKAVAKTFCDDPAVLGIDGDVGIGWNSALGCPGHRVVCTGTARAPRRH